MGYPTLCQNMSGKALYEALFTSVTGRPKYKMQDYEHVYKELQRDGVTLDLLWREYVEECRQNRELPYQSTMTDLNEAICSCLYEFNHNSSV